MVKYKIPKNSDVKNLHLHVLNVFYLKVKRSRGQEVWPVGSSHEGGRNEGIRTCLFSVCDETRGSRT